MRYLYHLLMYHYYGWWLRRDLRAFRKWAEQTGYPHQQYSDEAIIEVFRLLKGVSKP